MLQVDGDETDSDLSSYLLSTRILLKVFILISHLPLESVTRKCSTFFVPINKASRRSGLGAGLALK